VEGLATVEVINQTAHDDDAGGDNNLASGVGLRLSVAYVFQPRAEEGGFARSGAMIDSEAESGEVLPEIAVNDRIEFLLLGCAIDDNR
jgi:hypothetical protein